MLLVLVTLLGRGRAGTGLRPRDRMDRPNVDSSGVLITQSAGAVDVTWALTLWRRYSLADEESERHEVRRLVFWPRGKADSNLAT